jgi:hypothetical protein
MVWLTSSVPSDGRGRRCYVRSIGVPFHFIGVPPRNIVSPSMDKRRAKRCPSPWRWGKWRMRIDTPLVLAPLRERRTLETAWPHSPTQTRISPGMA